MLFENFINDGITLISIVGVLAMFISIVVQLTKDFIPKAIPTKLYVLVLSIVVTVVSVLCLFSYKGLEVKFYIIVGCVALGFIVAFITMYGWEELKSIKDRFIKK